MTITPCVFGVHSSLSQSSPASCRSDQTRPNQHVLLVRRLLAQVEAAVDVALLTVRLNGRSCPCLCWSLINLYSYLPHSLSPTLFLALLLCIAHAHRHILFVSRFKIQLICQHHYVTQSCTAK